MTKKYFHKKIDIENLVLDKENPRFAELYNGSDKESDIIEYLLYSESGEELAAAISEEREFYDDRPLWVFKLDDGKYLVKDGNRRCAAVKALQTPNLYRLGLPRFEIKKLPVLEYKKLSDLDKRIRLEHNSNLFKKWGRIAKAIEIYRLFSSGDSIESLSDIDSNPREFIKTATFYHQSVSIKGESFKRLVRDGRGKAGGKTIVFERLFKVRAKCGYNFRRLTSEIIIKDKALFESFINAIVDYLIQNPDTSSRTIDDYGAESFLNLLKPFGFPPNKPTLTRSINTNPEVRSTSSNNLNTNSQKISGITISPHSNNSGLFNTENKSSTVKSSSRYSIKSKPTLKRKGIHGNLKKLIDECYNLNENNFANSKTALTRVSLECTLKFVVENTYKPNGKTIKDSNHFNFAFKHKNGNPLPNTNFDKLKHKFTELIKEKGIRMAFENFDLQKPHQIIHNYRVGALPTEAKTLCNNLIDLIEFMLQEENELLKSLDLTML